MKAIHVCLIMFYSLALFSQERITSIESKNIRDEIHFFTANNRNYFSSIDDLDSISVYRINTDGTTQLLQKFYNTEYRESVIFEEYIMSKSGNARFHNMLTNQTYYMSDLLSEGELRWRRSIEGGHAILSQNNKNSYVIDLENFSIVNQSEENQSILNKYKEYLIYHDKNLTNNDYCIENTISGQSNCFNLFNTLRFSSDYLLYNNFSSLKYINLKELKQYNILDDYTDVLLKDSYEHLLLCTARLNETNYLFLVNMTNNSIYELGLEENYSNYQFINESQYVVQSNGLLTYKEILTGTTTKEFPYPQFTKAIIYDNDYILPNNGYNHIINTNNNEVLSFAPEIRSIRDFIEIDEGTILIYAQPKGEDGHLLYQFDSNNFTLEQWDKAPLTEYGLDLYTNHTLKDQSIYVSEMRQDHRGNIYQIDNNDHVEQINEGQFFHNSYFNYPDDNPYYITPSRNVWIELVNDSIYLYQQIDNQKHIANKIATSQLNLQPPYDDLSAIQNGDQSFLLIDSSYKNTIVEIVNGEITSSLQYDYQNVDLIDYDNGFLYIGDSHLRALDTGFNLYILEDIQMPLGWRNSRLIKLEDRTLYAAGNGLFEIAGSDYSNIIHIPISSGLFAETDEELYLNSSNSSPISYNKNTSQISFILNDYLVAEYSYPFIFLKYDHSAEITRAYNVETKTLSNTYPSYYWMHNIKKHGQYYYIIYGDEYPSTKRYLYRTDENLGNPELLKEFELNYPYGVSSYWKENYGILIAGHDIYICDENFELREVPEIAASGDRNIVERDGDIYFMATDPDLGKQLFKISDLSDVMVDVEDYDLVSNTLKIFPNPAQNWIELDGIGENASYTIYDINGQKVDTNKTSNNRINIDKLSTGTYFIHLLDNDSLRIGKLIVVK